MVGARTAALRCGTVTSEYMTVNVNGVDYIAQRRADIFAQSGDSGAPIFLNNNAIGIFSAFGAGSARYYSHVGYIDDMRNVTPCFDVRCGDGGT